MIYRERTEDYCSLVRFSLLALLELPECGTHDFLDHVFLVDTEKQVMLQILFRSSGNVRDC